MENITIGQIALIIAFLVAFIKGIEYLYGLASKGATKWLNNCLKPINDSINNLSKKIDNVDMNACKNFLVRVLADIEQNNEIDETERERFWEMYEHYIKNGYNGYIKDKVEKLKKAGKL